MANNFFTKNSKILLQLNMISIVIIFFCEIFVIYTFETKAFVEGIERWKYLTLLFGLIIVSVLFLSSVALFIYFLFIKRKRG